MLKQIWGNTTKIGEHDPDNFRYLVHGVRPRIKSASPEKPSIDKDTETRRKDPRYGDETICLFQEPERVAERQILSMSLISSKQRATWTEGGLILEVPTDNVIGNGSQDLGTQNDNVPLLLSRFRGKAIIPADELLESSHHLNYNEVVALAKRTSLVGFFTIVERGGFFPVDGEIAAQMKAHSERLGLPLIKIEKPNPFERHFT